MRNINEVFLLLFITTFTVFFNSCNNESSQTISGNDNYTSINITFPISVLTQGSSNPPLSNVTTYCLSQSPTYSNYANKIDTLKLIKVTWVTDSVKNFSKGNIQITLTKTNGQYLFIKTFPGVEPAKNNNPDIPFTISLSDDEKYGLESYLNGYLKNPNQCLEGSIQVMVLTGTPPFYLEAILNIVVEARVKQQSNNI